MKPVAFAYERPSTLADAAALLGQADVFSKALAGGQSLGPMLNLRLAQPDLLVDITSIPELTSVTERGDDSEIGACVTHADIEDGRVPDHACGLLRQVAGRIAYRAVRNRGTIGGSLAHADPAADWISALALIDARVVIWTPRGSRAVPVGDLIVSSFTTVLRPDELIQAIRMPKLSAGARWGFYKFSQKAGEFAHVIGGVLHDPARNVFRAVVGAIETAPIVVADATSLFGGGFGAGLAGRLAKPEVLKLLDAKNVTDTYTRRLAVVALERGCNAGERNVKTISLDINGRKVKAEIEPRLNLADFLREHQFLTGTHVGCEHGVCGACTVLLDGAPARSCITYAVACDGAAVTTIEGLEGDPLMGDLQEAFSEHHALQCGYCTPGMLVTARDILLRLPSPDERRIRLELSGNLCRCTGYAGIVAAVQSVASKTSAQAAARSGLGPVGSHPPAVPQSFSRKDLSERGSSQPKAAIAAEAVGDLATDWAAVEREGVELKQSFSVPFARAEVWRLFADLDKVARCMPGARLTKPPQDGRAEGEVGVKLGPIVSAFRGVLDVARDDAAFRGVVRGAGRDAKSPSSARAIITYEVHALEQAASRVDVSVKFLLAGPLAQFSRSGLVRDVADHLTRVFAGNLEAGLAGKPAPAAASDTLDAAAIARSAFFTRLRAFFRRLIGN